MKNFLLTFSVLCQFGGSLLAQVPEPTIQESLEVQLVELDVKVTDWQGNFIYNLSPEDLIIRENGKPVTIDKMEEIRLRQLDAVDEQAYKSRAMLLIDFQNTDFIQLRSSFRSLREYFELHYDQQSEMGIAINNGAIEEVQPFTHDRTVLLAALERVEKRYAKSYYREFYKARNGRAGFTHDFRSPFRGVTRDYNFGMSAYLSNEIEKIGQFVHYLGAYSGKKNLILLTGVWGPGFSDTNTEGSTNQNNVISIKDIQTACLYNKISVSVLGLNSGDDHFNIREPRGRDLSIQADWSGNLASSTAGYLWRATSGNLENVLYQAVEKGEQYYRIRYYSSNSDGKYRDLTVIAKGFKRLAYSFAGYYPEKTAIRQDTTALETKQQAQDYIVELHSDWLYWANSGWSKQQANYAVAVRAYDENGRILAEKVVANQLERKKKAANCPIIHESIPFKALSPARIETDVIDLNTGNQTKSTHASGSGV